MEDGEKIIDVCGKRVTDYLLQALSWFNRGGESIVLRGFGDDSSRVVQIATILQDKFGCKLESSEVNYLSLLESETAYLEIRLRWRDERYYPMNYPYPDDKFVDYPVYQLLFDMILSNGEIEIYTTDSKIGRVYERKGRLYFERVIEKEGESGNEDYYALRDAIYRAGLLLPSNWRELTKVLSSYDDVILGVDTNILLYASISEHLIPILHIYNPIDYAHTPNWILFVIPSTVMYELEEFANIRDRNGMIQRFGRRGFRALQEIIELNEGYDLPGISLVIVGETDPVLETRAEIQGLRQDLRVAFKALSSSSDMTFSRKSSSGDIIIRDQFKSFLRKIDFHKGVYFLTSDKSNAALADAEGLHSLYMKIPHDEFEREDNKFPEIELEGNPPIVIGVSIGKLLYELAVEFGIIKLKIGEHMYTLKVDLKGERIDRWIRRQLYINKYEYNQLAYDKGRVNIKKVMEIWNTIMREK